eukprot:TRINITY_DN23543_c0_g2_i1.p1 TRINITY_DN23543_c0_g2~~TRINITY_DN23543_c0_g2_i1.p1  ORF type:complete len:804 (-),score=117.86 TRINITY_DN23543_c0_g2_i1:144-2555(-)
MLALRRTRPWWSLIDCCILLPLLFSSCSGDERNHASGISSLQGHRSSEETNVDLSLFRGNKEDSSGGDGTLSKKSETVESAGNSAPAIFGDEARVIDNQDKQLGGGLGGSVLHSHVEPQHVGAIAGIGAPPAANLGAKATYPTQPPPAKHALPPRKTPPPRPAKAAELVHVDKLPLRTFSRYIVNTQNMRVKWACINWGGAYLTTHVVGGLEVQPLANLSRRISELGFNCVRLAYSTEGYVRNPVVQDSNLAANPQLHGMRFREVFDKVIESLTSEGLMVIINNHISKAGWCCNVDQDEGLWYVPHYNESLWIESLVGLATRYRHNPLVVAFDLRNEPHDTKLHKLTWGDGNLETDWALAAERAGNRILENSPDALIVVSAICFCMDLRPMKDRQIELMYPNRVVYEVHNYIEFQLATLITNNIFSWIGAERIGIGVACICGIIIIYLRKAWSRLGVPLPPRGVVRMTTGFWVAVANLVAAAVYLWMFSFYTLYCDYYAWTWCVPLICTHLGLAVCFAVLFAWGFFSYSHYSGECSNILGESLVTGDAVDMELSNLEGFVGLSTQVSRTMRVTSFDVDEDAGPTTATAQATGLILGAPVWKRADRIEPGWGSVPSAWRQIFGEDRYREVVSTHSWDRGVCAGMQCCCLSAVLCAVFIALAAAATAADSYYYLQSVFDQKWGFALQEGYPYTAPVWMGEFGQDTRGRYWKHLLSYMSKRDLDFAYWTFNGLKLSEGAFDGMGHWHPYARPAWEDESFGILNQDYYTIRQPWKIMDLLAVMGSPSGWVADDYPCDRAVLGNACGG